MSNIYLFLGGVLGYVLSAFLSIFKNFGIAVIFFALFATLITIPFDVVQRKSAKKAEFLKIEQEKIREKYKDSEDKDELNQELTAMYKNNHYNPVPGCLSQLISFFLVIGLLFAISSPLTSLLHIDKNVVKEAKTNISVSTRYEQLDIIREVHEGKDFSNYFSPEEIEDIKEIGDNFSFIGIDLFTQPKDGFPALAFALIYILLLLAQTMRPVFQEIVKKRKKGEAISPKKTARTIGLRMIIPVFVSVVCMFIPTAVVLYWTFSLTFGIIETIVIERKV